MGKLLDRNGCAGEKKKKEEEEEESVVKGDDRVGSVA